MIEIRKPSLLDLNKMSAIWAASLIELNHPEQTTQEYLMRALISHAMTSTSRILGAFYEGELIGFAIGEIGQAAYNGSVKGFCQEVHVLSPYKSHHAGELLIKRLIEWSAQYNPVANEFRVLYNERNLKRWTNLGYTPIDITFRKETKQEEVSENARR